MPVNRKQDQQNAVEGIPKNVVACTTEFDYDNDDNLGTVVSIVLNVAAAA